MAITLYGIPNCDTVKKARTWLDSRGLPHQFHDFKKAGVPADRLPGWIDALGWETVINRKGTTWRALDESTRAGVTDAGSACALALSNASLIKRPVVEWDSVHGGGVTVGFDAAAWAERV